MHRDHLLETRFSVTFYDKQINAKNESKFGSVQVLLIGDCIIIKMSNLFIIYALCGNHQRKSSIKLNQADEHLKKKICIRYSELC